MALACRSVSNAVLPIRRATQTAGVFPAVGVAAGMPTQAGRHLRRLSLRPCNCHVHVLVPPHWNVLRRSSTASGGDASSSQPLPENLQRIVDDYERQRAEEQKQSWVPSFLSTRYGGIIGLGLSGLVAYFVSCFDDVSSEVHTFTGWLLSQMSAERAQRILVSAAAWRLLPNDYDKEDPYLVSEPLEGLRLVSPVGLAAGFDEKAAGPNCFLAMGFGFVEVGPVGVEDAPFVALRLAARDKSGPLTHLGKVGVSVTGKQEELLELIQILGMHADYMSVDLGCQPVSAEVLQTLMPRLVDAAAALPHGGPKVLMRLQVPVYPEASREARSASERKAAAIAAVSALAAAARRGGADGIVICDCAERASLESASMPRLQDVIADAYRETGGELVIFASSDRIQSGLDALRCMEAGASTVQISSLLSAQGPQACRKMKNELSRLLMNEAFVDMKDVIGAAHRKRKKGKTKNPWAKAKTQ